VDGREVNQGGHLAKRLDMLPFFVVLLSIRWSVLGL